MVYFFKRRFARPKFLVIVFGSSSDGLVSASNKRFLCGQQLQKPLMIEWPYTIILIMKLQRSKIREEERIRKEVSEE
jgi:hypothetical protein